MEKKGVNGERVLSSSADTKNSTGTDTLEIEMLNKE